MSNLLSQLAAKNTPQKTKKETRPSIPVPANALVAFERMAAAKAVNDVVTARQDIESAIVEEIMIDSFAENIFKTGTQPANPKLVVNKDSRPDIEGIFQVQSRYKYNIMDNDQLSLRDRIVTTLKDAGFENAEKLVDAEIDASNSVSLRPFNEMVVGRYVGKEFVEASDAEKVAAEKVMNLVMGNAAEPLTKEERLLVTVVKESIKIKDGFLQRLKLYCKDETEVKLVLKVISPVHFVSHIKVGVNDTPEERVNRLIGYATEIFKSVE
jgi:hypothetical protein